MKLKSTSVLFCLLVLVNSGAYGQSQQRDSLRGFPGVCVLVEQISEEMGREGLTKEQLKTDVELRIRKAGIRVITLEEANSYLYVNLHAMRADTGLFAVNLTVEFKQPATLLKSKMFCPAATTWHTSQIYIVGVRRLSSLRESLGGMIDEFNNDFLAANQK